MNTNLVNEKEFNRVFSANLRKYLAEFKMSQSDLAKRLNVSDNTVSNWVRGNKSPRMDKLDAMCKIFSCRRSDLMEEKPTYYLNVETARVAQEVFDNPDLRILFDAARDAKPEDLRLAAEMLRKFKAANPD
jgi:transcriptional regulator with XRE-family HTH domain